jgi:predicted ABC-type ATPase
VRPKLWLVAGPNGAGKSTVVQAAPIQRLLPGIAFWDPDALALRQLQDRGFAGFGDAPEQEQSRAFIAAADRVTSILNECVASGMPVGVETVLSTDKYKPLVESVLAAGGVFGLIYVSLRSADLAAERVARRVRAGGHDVPVDRIRARWSRSLANLGWFAERASQFFVFDNSDSDPNVAPTLVAYGSQGTIHRMLPAVTPDLAAALAGLPRSSKTSTR